jgi:hypothetical protein
MVIIIMNLINKVIFMVFDCRDVFNVGIIIFSLKLINKFDSCFLVFDRLVIIN